MTAPLPDPDRPEQTLAAGLAGMTIAEIDALSGEQVAQLMGATAEEFATEPRWSWRTAAKAATQEYADRLADAVDSGEARVLTDPSEIRRRVGGRPRVGGEPGGGPSAQVRVRVTSRTRLELERIAKEQGRLLSEVSREALDEYVARHAG